MSDKEMVVKGLDWVINHKEILYERNKDFDDNELMLLDRTSLLMDRAAYNPEIKQMGYYPSDVGNFIFSIILLLGIHDRR